MMAPGTQWHTYDTKLRANKCDNSSMHLQMGYEQVFGLGQQI